MPNTYRDSEGNRWTKDQIERKIRKAKEGKLESFLSEFGYYFCEDCGRNDRAGIRIDCSHTISVNEAQNSGQVELAWQEENIKLRCRKCHARHDKNDVQF